MTSMTIHRHVLTPAQAMIIPISPALSLDQVRVASVSPVGEVEGYIAIWGSSLKRDAYGTWFDRSRPPEMGLENLPFTLALEHGMRDEVGDKVIGKIVDIYFDSIGIRFRAYLDQSHRWFNRIISLILAGKLGTSSGSGDYISRFDEEGRFVTWLITEVSLTESPAESDIPMVRLIRSLDGLSGEVRNAPSLDQQGLSKGTDGEYIMGDEVTQVREGEMQDVGTMVTSLLQSGAKPEDILNALLAAGVTPEQIAQMLAGTVAGENPAAAASLPQPTPALSTPNPATVIANTVTPGAVANPTDAMRSVLMHMLTQRQRQEMSAPPIRSNGGVSPILNKLDGSSGGHRHNVSVGDPNRFAHATISDFATAYTLLKNRLPKAIRSQVTPDQVVTEEWWTAFVYKTAQAAERGDKAAADFAVRNNFRMRDGRQIRANEVQGSTSAGFGDEWVGDLQGTTLWESIRMETPLYQKLLSMGMVEEELPVGFESTSIPLEGADPTWFVASGATDYDTSSGEITPTFSPSKFGTGEKQVTIAKLSSALFFQRELEEDSVIPIAQEANRKMRVSGIEQIEYILINGDVTMTANTNINAIDGTPASAPAQPSYTLLNGFLKLALITNTANARDASSTFDESDFLQTLKLMPGKNIQDRTKLLFILDTDAGIAASNIPTLKTRDTYSAATLEEGNLVRLWKVQIFESGQMALANTAGKVAVTTPANNTKGRILLVRPDQWTTRWKRRFTTDVSYNAISDTTRVVSHMRWGLAYRDAEASAVSYNVDVALS